MDVSLNLCDLIPSSKYCEPQIEAISKRKSKYNRVYIGSYFCTNKFLSLRAESGLRLLDRLAENSIKTTLVLPIVTQKNWSAALDTVDMLVGKYAGIIDELAVNDLGLIDCLYGRYSAELVAGRMLNKTNRDIRNDKYFSTDLPPKFFNEFYASVFDKYGITKIELDNGAREISIPDKCMKYLFCVHVPLCYVTKCNICEFASIHKPIERKFRASDDCMFECLNKYIRYEHKGRESDEAHYKIGCGVYFLNEEIGVKAENLRVIDNPFLEVIENEDIGAVE